MWQVIPVSNFILAAQEELYVGDRQAFVKCAADPKPNGGGGDRRDSRGGGRGRGRGRGNDRQSFGGKFSE